MAPIVHGLDAKYKGRIRFVYLDVQDPRNDQFKQALNYRVQPHIFLLDGQGKILKAWLGRVTEDQFVEAFQTVLKN
jgi:hypothetical protein